MQSGSHQAYTAYRCSKLQRCLLLIAAMADVRMPSADGSCGRIRQWDDIAQRGNAMPFGCFKQLCRGHGC